MTRRSLTVAGIILVLAGVAAGMIAMFNLFTQMDLVDDAGTAGNLMTLDVGGLAIGGAALALLGCAAFALAYRRGQRRARLSSTS